MRKNIYIASLLLLFMLAACGKLPDSLVLPQWDTNLNLPVTNKNYQLKDLIKEDKYIKIDSTGSGAIYRIFSDTIGKTTSVEDFIVNQFNTEELDRQIVLNDIQGEGYLALANGATIDSAFIKSCTVSIQLTNNSSSKADFEFSFPGFLDQNGNILKLTVSAEPSGVYFNNLILSNYSYSSKDVQDKNKIKMICLATGNNSSGTADLKIHLTDSRLAYVSGILPSRQLESIRRTIALPVNNDVLNFRDKTHLFDAKLILTAQYLSTHCELFEVLLQNLKVIGLRKDGSSMTLQDKSGNTNLGDIYVTGGLLTKEFTTDNSNISDLMSFLPDSLLLESDIIVNPNVKHGIASDKDSIAVAAFFEASSSLSFDYINYSDTLSFELSESNRGKIRDAKSVLLTYELTNSLPLETEMRIDFCNDALHSFFSRSISLSGATVIDNNGTTNPSYTKSQFSLDSAEIYGLSETTRVIMSLKMKTSDTQYKVTLSPYSWLKILSYCELDYHLNPGK